MKFYRTGNSDALVILLLPGTGCRWKRRDSGCSPNGQQRILRVMCGTVILK